MFEKKKNIHIKILVWFVYLLIAYILQATVFTRLTLWGVKPLLLPIVVVGAAIFDGRVTGGVVGIAAGMLCDLSFNEATIVFTLTLALVGLFTGYLAETVLVRSFLTHTVMALFALAVCAAVQVFGLVFVYRTPFAVLFDTVFRQTAVSLILSVPLFCVSRAITRAM